MPQRRARRCSFSAAPARFSISCFSQSASAMWSAFHEDAALALLDGDGNEPFLEAGPANASARVRRVGRAVGRAYQMQAPDIKELAGLPVQLHGHVRAAVEVSVDPALVAHRERRLWPSVDFDLKAHAVAAIGEIGTRADQAFRFSHWSSSSTLSTHAIGARASRSALAW